MADDRVYLNIPFAEKDEAKSRGARWDAGARKWYAPPHAYASAKEFFAPRRSLQRIIPGQKMEKVFTVPIHPYQWILTQEKQNPVVAPAPAPAPASHNSSLPNASAWWSGAAPSRSHLPAAPTTLAQHLSHYEQGATCENMATIALLAAGWSVQQAARHVDKYHHIDCFITRAGQSWSVDLKAIKLPLTPHLTWLEIINATGRPGWVFGDADWIMFETNEAFVAVDRAVLADHAMKMLQWAATCVEPRSTTTLTAADDDGNEQYPCIRRQQQQQQQQQRDWWWTASDSTSGGNTQTSSDERLSRVCLSEAWEATVLSSSFAQVTTAPTEALSEHRLCPQPVVEGNGDCQSENVTDAATQPPPQGLLVHVPAQQHTLLCPIDLRTCPTMLTVPKIPFPVYDQPLYATSGSLSNPFCPENFST